MILLAADKKVGRKGCGNGTKKVRKKFETLPTILTTNKTLHFDDLIIRIGVPTIIKFGDDKCRYGIGKRPLHMCKCKKK